MADTSQERWNTNKWLGDVLKMLGGTAKIPVDMGADALRSLSAAVLGGKVADPGKFTGETYKDLNKSTSNVIAPVGDALNRIRRSGLRSMGVEDAMQPEAATAIPVAPPQQPELGGPNNGAFSREFPIAPRPPMAMPNVGPQPPTMTAPALTEPPAPVAAAATAVPAAPAQQAPAAPAAPAMQPANKPIVQPNMTDLYAQALAKLRATTADTGDLTAEQKKNLQTQLWGNFLANLGQGKRVTGAFGEAASGSAKAKTEAQQKNVEAARTNRRDTSAEAFQAMQVADKQADNERQLQQIGITKDHYDKMDQRDQERLANEKRKLDAQGKRVTGHFVNDKNEVIFLTGDGAVPSGYRAKGLAPTSTDRKIAILRKAGLDDKGIADRLFPTSPTKGEVTAAKFWDTAVKLKTGDTNEEYKGKSIQDIAADLAGASKPSLPDPVANKGRTMTNPATGTQIKSDGTQWVPVR